jgi:cell wall-associated NlpC family hydrolase
MDTMMNWFFTSKDNQEVLIKEIAEWEGTPFRHLAGVKKAGTDCLHFALTVYDNIGATKNVLRYITRYGHDWCHHTDEQRFYNRLKKVPAFVEVGFKNPVNGDLILYNFGRVASHCGIYFEGNIHQAINLVGVNKMYYKDRLWAKRRRYGFRIRYV